MKKIKLYASSLLACLLLGACSPSGDSAPTTYNYGEKEMYQKIWEGNVVYNETVMLTEEDDEVIKGRLLYTPKRIISVRDFSLDKEYDSSNYTIQDDYIIRSESSSLPYLSKANVATTDMSNISDISTYDGKNGKILFTEGAGIVSRLVCVTYEHDDAWTGSIPLSQGDKLPSLRQKLKNKKDIILLFFIDDILLFGTNKPVVYIVFHMQGHS